MKRRTYLMMIGMTTFGLCTVAAASRSQLLPNSMPHLMPQLMPQSLEALNPSQVVDLSKKMADQKSPPTYQKGYQALEQVTAARQQIGVTTTYDPAYTVIAYPNGDVDIQKGVCTDVIIRAMRHEEVDLQQLIHHDMTQHFNQYTTRWGLKKPDANIDHRRVLNLETYMKRQGLNLPLDDFQTGDWVTWRVGPKQLPHIGLVSDQISNDGTPLIIHNIGSGTQEEDVLNQFDMVGHYRWPENPAS